MKKILLFLSIASTLLIGMGFVANAAPTSTYVQNLFITGLSGGGTECLHILNSGLVQVTAGSDCGSGSGGGLSSTTPWTLGGLVIASTSQSVTTIASNTYYLSTNPSSFISNISTTINTTAPLGGGGSLANNGILTLTCAGCLTANQSITWTGSGDATGTASGATSLTPTIHVVAIQGVSVTSSAPTNGDVLQYLGSQWVHTPTSSLGITGGGGGAATSSVGVTIDGGGNVITTSTPSGPFCQAVNFAGTINAFQIYSSAPASTNASGSIDVWKTNGAMPTQANDITGTDLPTLNNQQYVKDTSLTGWTTSVSIGDVFCFIASSTISTTTRMSLNISIKQN